MSLDIGTSICTSLYLVPSLNETAITQFRSDGKFAIGHMPITKYVYV